MSAAVIYGYCRVSTPKQKIERQIDNIKSHYPDAIIMQESFTGTKIDRPVFSKLMQRVRAQADNETTVTIVFDEVSRMSRTAQEGFELYQELYDKGIELVFLKEPHLNTQTYREAIRERVPLTGSDVDIILKAVNEYLMQLAKRQIELAFQTAESEVEYLHRRTSEGVRKAQERYNRETILGIPHEKAQVGRRSGAAVGAGFKEYTKAIEAKRIIRQHSKDFDGTLNDKDVLKLAGCARGSYYKYKRELKAQI